MTYRERRIERIDDALIDLKLSLAHPGSPCQVCGGFISLDLETLKVLDQIALLQDQLYVWRQQAWAREDVL